MKILRRKVDFRLEDVKELQYFKDTFLLNLWKWWEEMA
jgi:hypothetical protein